MRINAWLARGMARSRRECDELVRSGQVSINGRPAQFHDKVGETDDVQVRGRAVEKPRRIFILLNKPRGLLTAVRDRRAPTVMSLLPPRFGGLFPVGRLDRDTRGLLILTNDGDFAQRVMHPRHGVMRWYRAELSREPRTEDLSRSVDLADGPSRFANVRIVSKKPAVIEVGMREGRKRQIRLTLRAMGYRVLDLARTSIGDVQLGHLPEGEWREMTEAEVRGLSSFSAPKADKWRSGKKRRSRS